MNILDKIVEKTKERTALLDFKNLKKEAESLPVGNFAFENALKKDNRIKIIAEVKKASPSKGLICEDFYPAKIAQDYKKADVDCISVLTEPFFFMGKNEYIKIVKENSEKPILRKDFIIDPAQIYETKIIGADCILLICAILDEKKLKEYLEIAHSIGLSAIVETHDAVEIKMAINSGAKIIGVNNRNLKTFKVDFNNSINLRKHVPSEIIFISESGIKTREDIKILENAGVNAVLIGETFMKSKNKPEIIKSLRGE